MIKSFVYRLYPSKSQRKRLEATLETCRHFYNHCLGERKVAYETEQKTIGLTEQLRIVKTTKENNSYAKDVHSHVLQVVVADLQKAMDAFFRRVKSGEKPGYPRFKGRFHFHSFGFKEYGNGFKIDGTKLKLSGIGRVSVRWHRKLRGDIKTARIVCKAGKWYVAFSCDGIVERKLLPTGKRIGIDVGLSHLATLSNGEAVDNPRWYLESQQKRRVLQRTVARRTKSGSNRRKSILQLQKLELHVSRQRKDFLNKLVVDLIRRFDVICIEGLTINKMVKSRYSKSILDAGWGYFRAHLYFKAENAGRKVIEVNPAYTSKMCSGCGCVNSKLKLSDRWYSCNCGVSLDRDVNAAKVIRKRGLGRSLWSLSSALAGLGQEATA